MSISGETCPLKWRRLLFLTTPLLAGCSRAPSVDILGSFFPAWLLCFIVAIVLTALVRLVLVWRHIQLAMPILVYPAVAALFTFALWLIFFH